MPLAVTKRATSHLLKLLFSFGLIIAFFSTAANAQGLTPQRGKCSKTDDHARERTCLIREAKNSQIKLDAAEEKFLQQLENWDEESGYKKRTKGLFLTAKKQRNQFRKTQCELLASLAAGGNGAGDMRLECIIELNTRGTDDIRSLSDSLK
nr:lysozyme inhibitor LprI family protein [uncultured Undibacterium sp.]